MDWKEIKPVHPKGNQPWIFIGRTDTEAEAPILWPPDGKSWLIGKDPDAGKDWGQEKKGPTEDEMVGWHHHLSGHEFEQALGDGEGQGNLVRCSPRVTKSWTCLNSSQVQRVPRSPTQICREAEAASHPVRSLTLETLLLNILES